MQKPPPSDALLYSGKATTTFLPLNEGFWGLITEDGRKLDPVGGLPESYRLETLAVRITGRFQPGVVSIRMWGQAFELHSIELISADDEPDRS
jgi:hypothetical protein